jgi:HSP20 family protein
MSTLTRIRGGALSPFDFTGLSWLLLLGPGIRIEEHVEGDRYVLRAEVPGVDPAKDVEVSLTDGELRLRVERKETHTEKGRSEFHYGSFYRAILLPVGTKEDTLTATYADGILEITAIIGEEEPAKKTIPIKVAHARKS